MAPALKRRVNVYRELQLNVHRDVRLENSFPFYSSDGGGSGCGVRWARLAWAVRWRVGGGAGRVAAERGRWWRWRCVGCVACVAFFCSALLAGGCCSCLGLVPGCRRWSVVWSRLLVSCPVLLPLPGRLSLLLGLFSGLVCGFFRVPDFFAFLGFSIFEEFKNSIPV